MNDTSSNPQETSGTAPYDAAITLAARLCEPHAWLALRTWLRH